MQFYMYMQIKSLIIALFILLICGFFVNCSKDKSLNLPPSLQKLTEQTECSCNPYIEDYTLNENTIYIYSCGGPACDCFATYYDANGEEFQPQSSDQADFVKHVWSCKK